MDGPYFVLNFKKCLCVPMYTRKKLYFFSKIKSFIIMHCTVKFNLYIIKKILYMIKKLKCWHWQCWRNIRVAVFCDSVHAHFISFQKWTLIIFPKCAKRSITSLNHFKNFKNLIENLMAQFATFSSSKEDIRM